MNIYAVRLITFSPTHTSKQVGEAIVRGTGVSEIMKTDLTLHPAGKLEIPENTLAVIADTGNKSNKCQERENKMLIYN